MMSRAARRTATLFLPRITKEASMPQWVLLLAFWYKTLSFHLFPLIINVYWKQINY